MVKRWPIIVTAILKLQTDVILCLGFFRVFASILSPKVDAAVTMFSQYEIIETVRTGKVVMARGEQPT
jgi:hypothetical protein